MAFVRNVTRNQWEDNLTTFVPKRNNWPWTMASRPPWFSPPNMWMANKSSPFEGPQKPKDKMGPKFTPILQNQHAKPRFLRCGMDRRTGGSWNGKTMYALDIWLDPQTQEMCRTTHCVPQKYSICVGENLAAPWCPSQTPCKWDENPKEVSPPTPSLQSSGNTRGFVGDQHPEAPGAQLTHGFLTETVLGN